MMTPERLAEIRAEHERYRGAHWLGEYPFETVEELLEAIGPDWHRFKLDDDDRFALEHPIFCRPNLLACEVEARLRDPANPRLEPGLYRVELGTRGAPLTFTAIEEG